MVKQNLKSKVVLSELEAKLEQPPQLYNQTALYLLQDTVKMVKDNTTLAINALETVVYLTRPSYSDLTLKNLLDVSTFWEILRFAIFRFFAAFIYFENNVLHFSFFLRFFSIS